MPTRITDSINELSNVDLKFPIIADPTREVARLYDMLDEQDLTNLDEKGWVGRRSQSSQVRTDTWRRQNPFYRPLGLHH